MMMLYIDHWWSRLQCRLECDNKVNVANASSTPSDDYFVEHYNYLQFTYHQRTSDTNSLSLSVV